MFRKHFADPFSDKPKLDGGRPIGGYIQSQRVEKKDKKSRIEKDLNKS